MAKFNRYYPYEIKSELKLPETVLDELVRLFEKPPYDIEDILAGRAQVVRTELEGLGQVVIKYYKRGGFISRFNKDVYLRRGVPRSGHEFKMLQKVRQLGVSSPEPLVWAIRGGLFYKAFLITRNIGNHRSLVDVCLEDPGQGVPFLEKAAKQACLLIQNRIHHVDFHPGNVLVDNHGTVYIIDFDKAKISTSSQKKLCGAYIKRWSRAISKYNLPDVMTDVLSRTLTRLIS